MRYFDNERDFTRWVISRARERGWLVAHFGNSVRVVRTRNGGHKTIPDKDAAGFPDLVLAHPEWGLIFAELKMPGPNERPRENQLRWLRTLRLAGGCRVYLWTQLDTDEIESVLAGVFAGVRLWDEAAEALA